MIETYRIVRSAGSGSALYLPPAACAALGIRQLARTVLAHGARRLQADVLPMAADGDTLAVTAGCAEALGLADGIPYRLRLRQGELCIGPVIGILAARRTEEIDVAPGSLACHFLHRYAAVGGLVYLFGAEDVDLDTETVAGYCWTPDTGSPNTAAGPEWERARRLAVRVQAAARAEVPPVPPHARTARFQGIAAAFLAEAELPAGGDRSGAAALGGGRLTPGRFPFPAALWRRAGFLTQAALDALVSRMGARLFNSHFFDKLEGHRLLAGDPEVGPHLPQTEPLQHFGQLFGLLQRDGRALLKRAEGNSGYGLMRVETGVEAGADTFRLRFRESAAVEVYATRADLEHRLLPLLEGCTYLLQQCVDLPEYRGRLSDYRLFMQKDAAGRWQARGVVGRFGQRDAIVTNFINSGFALPADDALRVAFGLGYPEAHALKADLLRFATAVCTALDRTGGCYGDLGLGVGLDREHRPWLFEVNKLPFHEMPLYMGDEQMYLEVKSGPLLYAAHLAGFGHERADGRAL